LFTPHARNPEKYTDCRTDLIGGAATQTFAPDSKHPCAATDQHRRPDGRKLNVSVVVQTDDGNWAITEMLTTLLPTTKYCH